MGVDFFERARESIGQSYRILSQQLNLLKPKLEANQRPNQERSPSPNNK
jgi:hypothetical protein